jgi:hypothetical protein
MLPIPPAFGPVCAIAVPFIPPQEPPIKPPATLEGGRSGNAANADFAVGTFCGSIAADKGQFVSRRQFGTAFCVVSGLVRDPPFSKNKFEAEVGNRRIIAAT